VSTPTAQPPLAAADRYLNRDLSWIEFNQRVLEEARCDQNPLLERLKFLAITASNLDEFFMVRIGGLKVLAETGAAPTEPTSPRPLDQLATVRARARQFIAGQADTWASQIEPQLAEHKIRRSVISSLSSRQLEHLRRVFDEEIVPTVSPIGVSLTEPFPLLSGSPICLCLRLSVGSRELTGSTDRAAGDSGADERFVVVPLGGGLPRFLTVPADDEYVFALLEDVAAQFVDRLVPGSTVREVVPFRATRNADLELDEDATDDLLVGISQMLDSRKTSDCVRLEISHVASPQTVAFLQSALAITAEDVYPSPAPLQLAAFMDIARLSGFDQLKDPPWPPQPAPEFPVGCDIFDVIARGDRVLVHPYQTYDPIVEFVQQAARDPDVIAIKQTLYRTSRDSPIVAALADAALAGKYVTVIVELKARFDEARNIAWAQRLERAGVNVIYGVRGLKTHAKVCVVVRREPDGIRRYLHFGTGNYNEVTARLYSDVSFLTRDEQLGTDAVNFFNAITGLSVPQPLQKLAAAPIDLRQRLLEMIEVEIEAAQAKRPGRIIAKLNALVDIEMIDALYRASQAGVQVLLNVRGICRLRPAVKGLSDHVKVVSIVDRFLEHARILQFLHNGDERVFISSADWMGRNLDRRLELLVPIEDPACKARVMATLAAYFKDDTKAHALQRDGSYRRLRPKRPPGVRSQQLLFDEAREITDAQKLSRPTVFEPHQRK
jgi:polyphosphate kinase